MTTRIAFTLAGAVVATWVVTMPAAVTDPVTIATGRISGVTLASGVRAFKGIAFAAPPVGDLRWKEPQPAAKWEGIHKADQFGNVCVQPSQPNRVPNNVTVDLPDSPKTSEDCLYLNVWTSANNAGARQPVMVWIFGGAYTEGGGSSKHNDGEALARKGVVLVTFNYRLGPFGFFSHPELTKESGHNASGNQALADSPRYCDGSKRTSRRSAATRTTSRSSASRRARPWSAVWSARRSRRGCSDARSARAAPGWAWAWGRC
jgi:para-nitrobenzyl esterase